MKILITGAAGFVGGHLIHELQNNNHEVYAAINNNENPPKNVKTFLANLAIREEVESKIDFKNIDAIINLAGLAAVGPSFKEPEKYLTINPGIADNLYGAALEQGVKPRMLNISSGSLYDPTAPMPLDENSPIKLNSPYAESKVKQEEVSKKYSEEGFESIIARPFNHIGPGQKGGFIVPDFAMQIAAAERGGQSKIMVGDLTAKRDYTDVRDIVRAYRLLIESGIAGETYNICSGNSYSGQHILDGLLEYSNAKITVEQDPERMRPSDIPEIIGSHDKITSDTGWVPGIPLSKSLEDALNDWR